MASYKDWNIAIYNAFFKKNGESNILFFVDSHFIEKIGRDFGLKNNSIEEFYKTVLETIIDTTTKGKQKFDFEKVKGQDENKIPNSTAVIAFFILIAEKMVKDEKYSAGAYWPRVEQTIKKFYPKIDITLLKTSIYKDSTYEDIFVEFEEIVSKNLEITFEFYNILKNRIISRPISQTILSLGDKNILTENFNILENQIKKIEW